MKTSAEFGEPGEGHKKRGLDSVGCSECKLQGVQNVGCRV